MLGPGVLQVVVKQGQCALFQAFWYDHFAIFTEYIDVFNQLGGIAFLFSIVYEVFVLLFCLCYFSGCEQIDGILFISIVKHKVHGFLNVGS